IRVFSKQLRDAFQNRRFDELDAKAAALRLTKEVFGNGTWKITQFYDAIACRPTDPDALWQSHDRICQEWIATHPESITARMAHADFLISYAWRATTARASEAAVEEGDRIFDERMVLARRVLEKARALKEKDPCWWLNSIN